VLVTDHSTVGFEYCLLDRPIVLFDVPDLIPVARVNPEQAARLRRVGRVVDRSDLVGAVAADELAHREQRSPARRELAARMFYRPGTATVRAVALLYELLEVAHESEVADAPPACSDPVRVSDYGGRTHDPVAAIHWTGTP
jgi:CDP-glycerol glycerophosphotransferase (TagB/SpsB family)